MYNNHFIKKLGKDVNFKELTADKIDIKDEEYIITKKLGGYFLIKRL